MSINISLYSASPATRWIWTEGVKPNSFVAATRTVTLQAIQALASLEGVLGHATTELAQEIVELKQAIFDLCFIAEKGLVSLAWRRTTPNTFDLSLTVPSGVKAVLHLPDGTVRRFNVRWEGRVEGESCG